MYGSIYLVVSDFEKSVSFYERVLDMKVSGINGMRFAMFSIAGLNLCIMNGHFDSTHCEEVIKKGDYYSVYDDMDEIAEAGNTRKVFINLGVDNLAAEYQRIKKLDIVEKLTPIRFINYTSPYWYFTFMDPDGNPIEITGEYTENSSSES